MAHFFMLPTDENGVIADSDILKIDLPTALNKPFNFSEIFLYSHGWWTNAAAAMKTYNKFSIGFAKTIIEGLKKTATLPSHLAVGIHWPSMISEDSNNLINKVQPLSYWSMERRADNVGENAGYAFLRSVLQARGTIKRINLIGHSFGCRVVLSTLQEFFDDKAISEPFTKVPINVILLQAACDNDDLAPDDIYKDVIKGFPNLRMLITKSKEDIALQKQYPWAGKLANIFSSHARKALGADGPADAVKILFQKNIGEIDLEKGLNKQDADVARRLVIADLSAIHKRRREKSSGPLFKEWDDWGGSHCDIYFEELYMLMNKFLYGKQGKK